MPSSSEDRPHIDSQYRPGVAGVEKFDSEGDMIHGLQVSIRGDQLKRLILCIVALDNTWRRIGQALPALTAALHCPRVDSSTAIVRIGRNRRKG